MNVAILGVNEHGHESGNESMCDGRDLPWLQDTEGTEVWSEWAVTYRDVIVLDPDRGVVDVYNLTEHDLANPDDYAELLQLLQDAAE